MKLRNTNGNICINYCLVDFTMDVVKCSQYGILHKEKNMKKIVSKPPCKNVHRYDSYGVLENKNRI